MQRKALLGFALVLVSAGCSEATSPTPTPGSSASRGVPILGSAGAPSPGAPTAPTFPSAGTTGFGGNVQPTPGLVMTSTAGTVAPPPAPVPTPITGPTPTPTPMPVVPRAGTAAPPVAAAGAGAPPVMTP